MSYQYYMAIDAQASAVQADETNFPVALVLTSANLKTVANGGHVQNTASGGASGSLTVPADFVVASDSAGSSVYDFEIVAYNASTGAIELWVEITSLSSSSDTTIYLCYGDSGVTTSQEDVAGTWGNSFTAVWHLQGANVASCVDSAGSNDVSAGAGTPDYQQTGCIGYGIGFSGNSENVEIPNIFPSTGTIEVWVKTGFAASDSVVVKDIISHGISDQESFILRYEARSNVLGVTDAWAVMLEGANNNYELARQNETFGSGAEFFFAITVDYTDDEYGLFIDGTLEDTATDSRSQPTVSNSAIASQRRSDNSYNWDGIIDEVRISSVERDADWIATQYANQNDPTPSSTFWGALGGEVGPRQPRHPAVYYQIPAIN